MAIVTDVILNTGETKNLYLRVNNVDASNHGVESKFLVRGFLSEQSFRDGYHYLHEEVINFTPDVSVSLWDQAYSRLKELYPEHVDV